MSPAATVTLEDARSAVLSVADELFYERGIAAVAMSDVRDRSGVSMRRLYSLYPSKSDLVAAWLDERHRSWMAWFEVAVERLAPASGSSVLAAFDALAEWVASGRFRGCGFVNSFGEASEVGESHRRTIANHKRDLVDAFVGLVRRDRPDAPAWLAPAAAVLFDGAMVECAILQADDPLLAARSAARHLLEIVPS